MSINSNEDFIKRAFLQDIKGLKERAETKGVTAYAEKPSGRPNLRPNHRFLRNTIANVEHSNRREQEKEMWARRNAQLERQGVSTNAILSSAVAFPTDSNSNEQGMDTNERGKQDKQDPSKSSIYDRRKSFNLVEGEPSGTADEDLQKSSGGNGGSRGGRIHKKKVRGRGGIGPRIGPAGADVPDSEIELDYVLIEEKRADRKIGPTRPEKRKRGTIAEGGGSGSSSSSVGSSSDSESDSGEEERRRKRRERKRRKEKAKKKDDGKRKKEKKKKKKKERK